MQGCPLETVATIFAHHIVSLIAEADGYRLKLLVLVESGDKDRDVLSKILDCVDPFGHTVRVIDDDFKGCFAVLDIARRRGRV